MRTVGVRELRDSASEVLRHVREDGETVEITYRGRVVARIVPAHEPQDLLRDWAEWNKRADALAKRIGEHWTGSLSAVDAVREQRRDL